jgi:ubiquitin-conjugating enzyme E2 J2
MSFMNSEEMTAGSISATEKERKWHAARSRWWNSTGGGSAAKAPKPGNNIGKSGPGVANIRVGDGGVKFRFEWPDEDKENWTWIEENRIDPATGKILPDPEGEVLECSAEATRLRRILGSGSKTGLGQVAREAGEGWFGRWKWWLMGGFVAYLVVSRMILGTNHVDDL